MKASLSLEHLSNQTVKPKLVFETSDLPYWIGNEAAFYFDKILRKMGLIEFQEELKRVKHFLSAPKINSESLNKLQEKVKHSSLNVPVINLKVVQVPKETPIFCLKIVPRYGYSSIYAIEGTVSVKYGEFLVHKDLGFKDESINQKGDTLYKIPRDPSLEQNALAQLRAHNWDPIQKNSTYVLHESYELPSELFFSIKLNELRDAGWEVHSTEPKLNKKVHFNPEFYGDVSETTHDWFDLELGLVIDGKKINMTTILSGIVDQVKKNPSIIGSKDVFLSTQDNQVLIVPSERLNTLIQTFLSLLNPELQNDKIPIPRSMIPVLEETSKQLSWQAPAKYKELQDKFSKTAEIKKITPPTSLLCTLRSYQIEGLSWMQFLTETELGGILADDMGLGKTIQTLAHILVEKEKGSMTKPTLIVAPTSLMGNWLNEAKKFAPTLSVLILQGLYRKNDFDKIASHDIVLTTYPLLARDEQELLKQEFHLLILDEAQMIKNAKTKAHQVLRNIKATHKLCLTGTPMENHLGELWSLFHIILPGFLGTDKQFQSLFRKPIEKEGSSERKAILQKRIHPFLLRRTKEEVVRDLPPKTEIVIPITLTKTQQDLYEAVRMTMMKKVFSHVEEKGLAKSRIILLDALLKLRQICCDPRLLKSVKHTSEAKDSAKLSYLLEVLPQMIEEKRQILLFSQFTSMLSLIEEELKNLNIPYVILTGDTLDRITPIEEFQSGRVPLFLISLKAGGTGLNLTAADTIIHYDPWWNPAVESQATARAHRIGQTKPIFVYKWIASSSIEEKIMQLQERKKGLVQGLLEEKENQMIDLQEEELYTLFAPLTELIE